MATNPEKCLENQNRRKKLSRQRTRRGFVRETLRTSFGVLCASGLWKHFGTIAYAQEASFDVVVVGSGAAGMTAALKAASQGLKVLVVEKAAQFGGTTARSGGGIWIRNSSINQAAGLQDSFHEALGYMRAVVGEDVSLARQEAFLQTAPQMIDFVMAHTPLKFRRMEGYSDYYPEVPGGKPEGASIEPEMFDGHLLGKELANLAPPYIAPPPGVVIYGGDYKWLCLAKVSITGAKRAALAVSRFLDAKVRLKKPLTMGQALAAGLRVGLMTAGIPLWLKSPLVDLTVDGEGRVDGLVVNRNGVNTRIYARKGVILASGGFERNLAMRLQHQPRPIGVDWTLGAPSNTGDGIRAGERLGAATDLMDDAWWGPSIVLAPGKPYFCLSERSMPGSLLVNASGERFVNESAPYHDVVHAMYLQPEVGDDRPVWLIVDQNYRNRYLFRDVLPGMPLPKEWFANGAVFSAETVEKLAEKIGVSDVRLRDTVSRFNGYAERGEDPDFARGQSAYDRYYADPGVEPNPSLAPLSKAPFYAFKMVPGDLGTKGGLLTDERARVLQADGHPIPGLYAAGNVTASVMGRSYPGNGSTLAPAMTFGYIAAQDLAERKDS
jgi:3-oxosteroid 1-dehydrogenase